MLGPDDLLAFFQVPTGKMTITPDRIVVQLSLKERADKLLNTRIIKWSGQYHLNEYEGKRWWESCRYWDRSQKAYSFPRIADGGWYATEITILPNRHWRKRGYPKELYVEDMRRMGI